MSSKDTMLLRAIATITSFTLLSRVLGFVRDACMAKVLGAGMLSDIFLIAFKIPNFFRRLLAEGAFNAAFVPLFAKAYAGEGAEDAKRFAGEALMLLLLILSSLVLLVEVFMPYVMTVIAPGYAPGTPEFLLSVDLTRITFPYIAFVSVVALFGGVLNTLHQFKYGAFSPTLLNLIMIASLYGFEGHFPTSAHNLAVGVVIGGVAQLLLMLWALWRFKMLFAPRFSCITERSKRLLRLMLPGMLGAGVFQLNVFIDTMIATMAGEGSVSYLYFADRINQLPLGSIGIALGTALLPMLAAQLKRDERSAAVDTYNQAVRIGLFIALPCMAAIMALGTPIIDVLFRRGAFTVEDAAQTSLTLKMFALGLPAFILAKILTAPFFAMEDTRTPVKIAIVCVLFNLVSNLVLGLHYGLAHQGIALSTAMSGWLNVFLLQRSLKQRYAWHTTKGSKIFAAKSAVAALILGIVAFSAYTGLKSHIDYYESHGGFRFLGLMLLCGLSSASFLAACWALKLGSPRLILAQLKRKKTA
ncbi:MAG: murein biosynthesis integral membrane protein MurJ [Thalassospira sp.]|nr:murein biosynthesis integral membrane protein MurJ [Thalassospira sp.]